MNCWFNPINPWTETAGKIIRKTTDMVAPPRDDWVTIDENPDSINDGWFVVNVTKGAVTGLQWVDYPASYHNNAGAILRRRACGNPEMERPDRAEAVAKQCAVCVQRGRPGHGYPSGRPRPNNHEAAAGEN